tara:strand:- start:73 stop:342 length:270 start_codon:yes stop_codon:yes gene_type:complete
MGFDLTGYEPDYMEMKPFAVYTAFGIISLLVVVFGIYFYLIAMGEKYTQELYLERDTVKTIEYKKNEEQFLKSHKLKAGIDKALDYYND